MSKEMQGAPSSVPLSAKHASSNKNPWKGTSHPDMPPPRPVKRLIRTAKQGAAKLIKLDQRERIAYVYSDSFADMMGILPAHEGRSALTHSLILTYDRMLKSRPEAQSDRDALTLVRPLEVVEPVPATLTELLEFHDRRYLELIYKYDDKGKRSQILKGLVRKRIREEHAVRDSNVNSEEEESESDESSSSEDEDNSSDNDSSSDDDEGEEESMLKEYGLEDDAQLFDGISLYMEHCVGASLTAARLINTKEYRFTVNLEGGRHHAMRAKAAGFCYANDVVLSILELLKCDRHKRVLCVDIDVHHGDGQEQAFLFTDRVLTLSFHQYSPGLYPGTGNVNDIGKGRGENYNINVPLKEGMDDESFVPLFKGIVAKAMTKHRSNAIVLVCGVDGLATDPLGTFNLTNQGYERCVHFMLQLAQQYKVPMLVLGGGGYEVVPASSCFASIVGVLQLNKGWVHDDKSIQTLPDMIPMESHRYDYDISPFASYGFQRNCTSKTQEKNQNDKPYLTSLQSKVFSMLDRIK